MDGQLDNLDGRVVASLDRHVRWQRNLWQTHGARIWVLAGTENLEWRNHWKTHVQGTTVGSLGADAHVDVKQCRCVALEPTWLESESAADRRPVRPVRGQRHAAAYT